MCGRQILMTKIYNGGRIFYGLTKKKKVTSFNLNNKLNLKKKINNFFHMETIYTAIAVKGKYQPIYISPVRLA